MPPIESEVSLSDSGVDDPVEASSGDSVLNYLQIMWYESLRSRYQGPSIGREQDSPSHPCADELNALSSTQSTN